MPRFVADQVCGMLKGISYFLRRKVTASRVIVQVCTFNADIMALQEVDAFWYKDGM